MDLGQVMEDDLKFKRQNISQCVEDGTAEELHKLIEKTCNDFGINDISSQLVGFMSDGASVNFGCKSELVVKLKQLCPWLIGIHCLNEPSLGIGP